METLELGEQSLLKYMYVCYQFFSCEEAALEVRMSLCLSVCLSVYQVKLNPVNRGLYREQTLQVRVMQWGRAVDVQWTDITCKINVQGTDSCFKTEITMMDIA